MLGAIAGMTMLAASGMAERSDNAWFTEGYFPVVCFTQNAAYQQHLLRETGDPTVLPECTETYDYIAVKTTVVKDISYVYGRYRVYKADAKDGKSYFYVTVESL